MCSCDQALVHDRYEEERLVVKRMNPRQHQDTSVCVIEGPPVGGGKDPAFSGRESAPPILFYGCIQTCKPRAPFDDEGGKVVPDPLNSGKSTARLSAALAVRTAGGAIHRERATRRGARAVEHRATARTRSFRAKGLDKRATAGRQPGR